MQKNKSKAIWFLFTTMLSIFSICTIRIFDGYRLPFYAVTANAIFSLGGLIFQLHVDEEKQKKRAMIPVHIVFWLNSLSVFMMLGLSLFILESQYHNRMKPDMKVNSVSELSRVMEEGGDGVTLLETDQLYIYYADYDDVSFVAGKRPSKKEESSLLCVAVAFQAGYEIGFTHENVVGWHASDGQLERGKPEKNLGAFTYIDGEAAIWNVDEAETAVKKAADAGGCGYQQFVVLCDGERGTHTTNEFRCFRVLAVVNGRACVIDTRTQMHYEDFITALVEFGIEDALYCDMGSGWNYSWYRNEKGKTVDIIGIPWPFSHNWLIFQN